MQGRDRGDKQKSKYIDGQEKLHLK
jgi:hypothetical protein